MPQPADRILIEQVLQGDGSAYEALVNRYKNMAYTIAYRITRSNEDAEEVAQDAFLKAYNHLSEFKKESKFSTWLYSIVYNAAISKTRKKKLDTSTINDEMIENVGWEDSVNQLSELNQADQQHYIREALTTLPADEATLITLYYMEDQPINDISEVTGLSVSNVKVKLHRARKRLHVELQKSLQHELAEII